MVNLGFDGRVAIVTGAGRGLGRAHAIALADRGAAVVVNDLGVEADGTGSGPVADEVVAEILRRGGRAVASYDDVADQRGAEALVATALGAYGQLDVLINNAGIFRGGALVDQPLEDFEAVLRTHVVGAVATTRAAWPHLCSRGYGRVVMTTSAAGFWGAAGGAAYSAAKAALVGLTAALAEEGAAHGVAVNSIAPGAETRLSAGSFTKAGARTWRPELVVPAVLYLAHEMCSQTGEHVTAVAGRFARVQVVQSPGHAFDARREVTVEDYVEHLDDISDMAGAECFAGRGWQSLGLSATGSQLPGEERGA